MVPLTARDLLLNYYHRTGRALPRPEDLLKQIERIEARRLADARIGWEMISIDRVAADGSIFYS